MTPITRSRPPEPEDKKTRGGEHEQQKKTRKRMRATAGKVIAPFHRDGEEKAQINIPEADPLYQEVRITNELTDEVAIKPDSNPTPM